MEFIDVNVAGVDVGVDVVVVVVVDGVIVVISVCDANVGCNTPCTE
jgi:hypothetical protein